jgi:uncharacterized protein (UPF0264 family)
MTQLLVSVRNAEEAEVALDGGADIIDVKEPLRGALGRADDSIIRDVINAVAGRAPVSAALGELHQNPSPAPDGLAFTKAGLSALGASWRKRWLQWREGSANAVLVAYADVHDVQEFVAFANEVVPAALLVDTSGKDGQTLLSYYSIGELASLRELCQVPVAFAGSLGLAEIAQLLTIQPDIIAVRGAACLGGRHGTVDADLVRQLANGIARTLVAG